MADDQQQYSTADGIAAGATEIAGAMRTVATAVIRGTEHIRAMPVADLPDLDPAGSAILEARHAATRLAAMLDVLQDTLAVRQRDQQEAAHARRTTAAAAVVSGGAIKFIREE